MVSVAQSWGGAYDAVVANEAEVALAALPSNEPVNEPVNDPVLICRELDTSPLGLLVRVAQSCDKAYDAVVANEADVAVDALPSSDPVKDPVKDPVLICRELDTNPLGLLAIVDQSLVNACEAVSAYDADVAVDALPNNEPVNEPAKDPVLICKELDTNPEGFPVNEFQSAAAPDT